MGTLLILIALGIVSLCWHRMNSALFDDTFSPFNLLFYFWVAPFVFSLADLSSLQGGMEAEALAVILLSTSVLILTCLMPSILRANTAFERLPGLRKTVVRPVGILVFFFLTAIALYFAEFNERELPLVAYLLGGASDSNLHTFGKDSKLQVIAYGIHAAAIPVFYLWLNEPRLGRRSFYLALSGFVIALGLFKTSKSDIFIPLLSFAALISYHYRAAGQPLPKAYKITAIASVMLIVSITSIRLEGIGNAGGYAGLIEFKYSDELGVVGSEMASIVYGYSSLGFQNFSNYVGSHTSEFRIGTSLFRPFLSALMMGSVADSMAVPVSEWNVVSAAANTGTFLTPLYIEGGLPVCLLGSLLYGLLVNSLYIQFRRTGSVGWMFGYVSVLFPWTWLFFTNAFSVLSIYVNLFYIAVLSWRFVDTMPVRDTVRKRSRIPRRLAITASSQRTRGTDDI